MDQYLHGHLSEANELLAEDFSNRTVSYGEDGR